MDGTLRNPSRERTLQRGYERQVARGLKTLSWFIYRFTSPAMRKLFADPRNDLQLEQAMISMLAGDVFRDNGVHWRLRVFKLIYFITALGGLKEQALELPLASSADSRRLHGRHDQPGQRLRCRGSRERASILRGTFEALDPSRPLDDDVLTAIVFGSSTPCPADPRTVRIDLEPLAGELPQRGLEGAGSVAPRHSRTHPLRGERRRLRRLDEH